jgi:hypothetical protein
MKHSNPFVVALVTIITTALMQGSQKEFKIILEPKWENLEHDEKLIDRFGGRWILAGSITFKKKAKECVHLTKLHLKWHGPFLDKVTASLYEHNFEKKFYPIEDFFVCDGIWNKKNQTLHFNFPEKCTLQAINTFYLVLTVPADQEPLFKQGSFCIADECLPDQLKEHIESHELSLSLNTFHKKVAMASH